MAKLVPILLAWGMCTACGAHLAADAGSGADAGDPFVGLDGDASLALRVDRSLSSCRGGPETGCHSDYAGHTHLTLGPGNDVVGVASFERPDLLRIAPGDPDRSYLVMKLIGAPDAGLVGTAMPPGGPWPPTSISLVEAWIEAGAPAP